MSAEEFYSRLGRELPDGGSWRRINCISPDHEDLHGSCDVNVDSGGFHCKACGAKGSAYKAALLAGLRRADAARLVHDHGLWEGDWDEPRGEGVPVPPKRVATVQPPDLTLVAYAEAKQLPADFLRGLGISDYKDSRFPQRVLRVPYRTADGDEPAVRIRKELDKRPEGTDERFLWRKGSKPCLYGLWRLEQVETSGYVVLAEGESDCHTLWHHNIPALGLAGATGWKDSRDAEHLAGIEHIYVVIEPDQGGEALLGWLATAAIRDRVWLVQLGEHADPSGLHLADPEGFTEAFTEALERAEPWRVRAAELEDAELRQAAAASAVLAREPRILEVLERDLHRVGLAGEERLAKLIYLAATSRLLVQIVSVAVKGPSAAGKSYTVRQVLRFVPEDGYHALTAMSDRALAFGEEPLEHRHLVMYEAAGMEGEWTTYMIRSLLSEGHIRYEITEKDGDGRHVTRLVERPGPTGLIVTTTAVSLHAENETRLISLVANDTPEQTARVMLAVADAEEDDGDRLDFGPWHALQRWIGGGERRVAVPYRLQLAELIPPVAVRLRRDFGAVLALVRAHALLHKASRERDGRGRVVASIDDYAAVRDLVVDLISDQAGATVRDTVRETVAAVAELLKPEGVEHVTRAAVARQLKLDKSAGQRRVDSALSDGYLRNLENRPGRPAQLVLGEPLPEERQILPDPAEVAGVAGLQSGSGGHTPPLPLCERERGPGRLHPRARHRPGGLVVTGPYVPIQHWPEPTRRAVTEALKAKAENAAERIRAKATMPRCTCASAGERADDGRCRRCWGWPS